MADVNLGSAASPGARGARTVAAPIGQARRISNATISMIESNAVNPSVGALKRVLDAVPIGLSEFFAMDQWPARRVFYRAGELDRDRPGPRLLSPGRRGFARPRLADAGRALRARRRSGKILLQHQGEECGIVIRGQLEVTVGARRRCSARAMPIISTAASRTGSAISARSLASWSRPARRPPSDVGGFDRMVKRATVTREGRRDRWKRSDDRTGEVAHWLGQHRSDSRCGADCLRRSWLRRHPHRRDRRGGGHVEDQSLDYFRSKDDLYKAVLTRTLEIWLRPPQGARCGARSRGGAATYIAEKLDASRRHPEASRLFAIEIMQGAPHLRADARASSPTSSASRRHHRGLDRAG